MKKVILGLAIILGLSMYTPILAKDSNIKSVEPDIAELSEFIYKGVLPLAKESLLYENQNNISVGEGIYLYEKNDNSISVTTNIVYLLYGNGKAIGIVRKFFDNDGTARFSYQEEYTNELSNIIDNSEKVLLLGEEYGTSIIGNKQSTSIGIVKALKSNEQYINSSGVVLNHIQYKLKQLDNSNVEYATFSIYALGDYPNVGQGSNYVNICWAACAASAIYYKGHGYYTPLSLAGGCDVQKSMAYTKTVLNNHSVTTGSVISSGNLSQSSIVTHINAYHPIFAGMYNASAGGHMVVIIGYNASNSTIKIMDPWGSTGSSYYVAVSNYSPLSFQITLINQNSYYLNEYLVINS